MEISKNRKLEIENPSIAALYRQKIGGFNEKQELDNYLVKEDRPIYSDELIF